MSNKERRGTPPKRGNQSNHQQTAAEAQPAADSLSKGERNRLHALGYKNEHIESLSLDGARQIIAQKTPRAGSKAHLDSLPAGFQPPASLGDEAIAVRDEKRVQPSGVVVTLDEYTGRLVAGDNPIDSVLLDLEARFPGRRFRAINPDLPPPPGPQFQPVFDAQGKKVTVADLEIGFMPEQVYQDFYVKQNAKRSAQMMGEITDTRPKSGDTASGDTSVAPGERAYAPVEGKGLTIQPNYRDI